MTTAERNHWLGKPVKNRLEYLNNLYIEHEAAHKIFDYIDMELLFAEVRNKGLGALIISPSGCGKTTFIKELVKRYPTVVSETLTTRPVVHFSIPKSPSKRMLGQALLKAMGDPAYKSGTADDLFDRIKVLVVAIGVRIICIDNFHDVPARRRKRGIASVGDWIRDLCELEFPGLVAAFGTQEAAIVRDSNDQLLRRMQARLELPLFTIQDQKGLKLFRNLIVALDNSLPLAESSCIVDPKVLPRIHRATGGNLDYLIKLLGRAIYRACEKGRERIELEDLRRAFEDQHQIAASFGNPFNDSYDGHPLDRVGQIFHRVILDEDREPRVRARERNSQKEPA